MFTGIIEQTGRVESLLPQGDAARLRLTPDAKLACALGDSLSVNGVCLTVADFDSSAYEFDLSPETLKRSTFGALKPGDLLNLERALKVGDRLGGHFVSGHVDGLGNLLALRTTNQGAEMDFSVPKDLLPYVTEKGSISIDGISLTPFALSQEGFTVALVPHTLVHTTLGFMQIGATVNLEVDLLARYVKRLMEFQ